MPNAPPQPPQPKRVFSGLPEPLAGRGQAGGGLLGFP